LNITTSLNLSSCRDGIRSRSPVKFTRAAARADQGEGYGVWKDWYYGSPVGSNWTLRETLEFAAKEGGRAKVRCFGLSGLNELVEVYKRGEGRKLLVGMDLVG
jgi:hypothetical protein